jgi:hypothetical protein
MTVATFLLIVLAVMVGNNISIPHSLVTTHTFRADTTFVIWFFNCFGFVVLDDRLTQTSSNFNDDGVNEQIPVNSIRIKEYIAQGKWRLHLGHYYVFFISTKQEREEAQTYLHDWQHLTVARTTQDEYVDLEDALAELNGSVDDDEDDPEFNGIMEGLDELAANINNYQTAISDLTAENEQLKAKIARLEKAKSKKK